MSDYVMRPRPNPKARLRIFCLPCAGGAGSMYCSWPDDLPPQVEVCPIQLPGRENRLDERPHTQFAPLVRRLTSVIRPYLDLPFVVFGHSLGALIAFELVRQLRRQGAPMPVHLFVCGRRAPHVPNERSSIHQLPDAEFVEELHKRYGGIPDVIARNRELLQAFLPALRADTGLLETYAYSEEPSLKCPILAFGGLQDDITREELGGWQAHTSKQFQLQMLPGDHFFLRNERTVFLENLSRNLCGILGR